MHVPDLTTYETENKVWHQEKNEWVPNTKMTPKCENLYSQETAGIYFEDTCFETMDYFHIFFPKTHKTRRLVSN